MGVVDRTALPALGVSQPLVPLVDEFASRLFAELDYVQVRCACLCAFLCTVIVCLSLLRSGCGLPDGGIVHRSCVACQDTAGSNPGAGDGLPNVTTGQSIQYTQDTRTSSKAVSFSADQGFCCRSVRARGKPRLQQAGKSHLYIHGRDRHKLGAVRMVANPVWEVSGKARLVFALYWLVTGCLVAVVWPHAGGQELRALPGAVRRHAARAHARHQVAAHQPPRADDGVD